MSDYLQDAALISIAFDLPMFDHQLLSAARGRAPNPKDARTKQILSCGVIKHEPRPSGERVRTSNEFSMSRKMSTSFAPPLQ